MSFNTKYPELAVIISPSGDLQIFDNSESMKHKRQLIEHLQSLGIEINEMKTGWCG